MPDWASDKARELREVAESLKDAGVKDIPEMMYTTLPRLGSVNMRFLAEAPAMIRLAYLHGRADG